MTTHRSLSTLICLAVSIFFACTPKQADKQSELVQATTENTPPAVLVFSKTGGWVHTSIPAGRTAFLALGRENGFRVDTTKNADYFVADSLEKYAAVVFLNTSKEVLNEQQQAAFENYIRSGGGFMGVHAATDTEYEWPWYNQLVGAYFVDHPKEQTATVRVIDKNHPATRMLDDNWVRFDEWYNFKNIQPHIKVLAYLDEQTYEGGTNGEQHPIVWYHEFDGGRSFYTGLGHTPESYADPLFQQHLLGGLRYVMGLTE